LSNDVNVVHVDNDYDVIYKSKWNKIIMQMPLCITFVQKGPVCFWIRFTQVFKFIYNRLLIFSKLSVKRTFILSTTENLDVNNIDVDTVNDVVLNCNSIIKNAADKAEMIVELKPKKRPSVGSKKCQPYFNQVY
jgi:hypothetical protein